jgi:hypothetical protein
VSDYLLQSAFLQKTNSSASKIFVLFGSGSFFLSYLSGTLTFLLLEQNLQLLKGWLGHTPEAIKLVERYLQTLLPSNEKLNP